MALLPTTALYQPFRLESTITIRLTIGITDYDFTIAAGWYRIYLAPTTGAGTSQSDPKEFLGYVKSRIEAVTGPDVTLRMRTDGRVEMTTAVSSSWSLNWTVADANGAIVRNLLGYNANIPTRGIGVYAAATYQPTHALYGVARTNDNGWLPDMAAAGDRLPSGVVYEFNSGHVTRDRTFDLEMHPYFYGDLAAADVPSTPLEQRDPLLLTRGRWRTPSASPHAATFYPPWSAVDFLFTCGGRELGCAFGNFQALVAATTSLFETAYLLPESRKRSLVQLQQPNWSPARALRQLSFSYRDLVSRS